MMRALKTCITAIVLTSAALPAFAAPFIKAESALLLDADTGEALFEKDPDEIRPPASTTKMMTAILLIENARLSDVVSASKSVETVTGSSLHMKAGERITVRDLLYAILLRSANDACVVAAEHVSGSIEKFARLMNEKALAIGMLRTHFANPHGLTDPLHYTTARDLAALARYAMANPTFSEIVRTPKMWVTSRSVNREDLLVRSHNRLLGKYPGMEGVKTGYTVPAGRCFVGCASRDGWRLVSVVLKSPNWQWETKALLDYGFTTFQRRSLLPAGAVVGSADVVGGAQASVSVIVPRAVQVPVPTKGVDRTVTLTPVLRKVQSPVSAGQVVGEMRIRRGNTVVGAVPLVAKADVAASIIGPTGRRVGWSVVALALGAALLLVKRRNG